MDTTGCPEASTASRAIPDRRRTADSDATAKAPEACRRPRTGEGDPAGAGLIVAPAGGLGAGPRPGGPGGSRTSRPPRRRLGQGDLGEHLITEHQAAPQALERRARTPYQVRDAGRTRRRGPPGSRRPRTAARPGAGTRRGGRRATPSACWTHGEGPARPAAGSGSSPSAGRRRRARRRQAVPHATQRGQHQRRRSDNSSQLARTHLITGPTANSTKAVPGTTNGAGHA